MSLVITLGLTTDNTTGVELPLLQLVSPFSQFAHSVSLHLCSCGLPPHLVRNFRHWTPVIPQLSHNGRR